MTNINRVVLTGHLTRDPELRALPSGTSVCELRVGCNGRRKDQSSGEWVDRPNFFNVKVWGGQGEAVAANLTKGSGVAIDGRLDWREWETQEGSNRQAVEIIAETVQFLAGGKAESNGSGPELAGVTGADGGEDIPF
jgi:single-strand DNA-binding protein